MLFITHFSIRNTLFNYFLIVKISVPSLIHPLSSQIGYYFVRTVKMFRSVFHQVLVLH